MNTFLEQWIIAVVLLHTWGAKSPKVCFTTTMYLGIDIGGTKTLLARITTDGTIEETLKFPTPQDYAQFLAELRDNVTKITTEPWQLVASSAPGKIDRTTGTGIVFGNLPWQNVPLRDDIAAITGTEVLIENDVKLAGLSEARAIDPIPHKTLYVTFSTGVSDGIVVDGVIDPELQDSEAGHMLFEKDGKLVTWESFASGKAITAKYGKFASEIDDEATWREITQDMALGLYALIADVQPDIIVVGGGVGSHFHKYGQYLTETLKSHEDPMVTIPPIIGAKRAEEAVIYGCYELMKDYQANNG